ncbi:MAG: lysophospholipid acyltransferase family protein [Ferruginibacter sp.]
MYYLISGVLFILSLLPFFVLYIISDIAFFFIYHIAGYRKKVVMNNLDIAFPGKTPNEKKIIAKQFYKNLVDTFIETIKILSISEKEFDKRVSIDTKTCNEILKYNNIQFHSGHQMNWEYAQLALARNLKVPWVAVYFEMNNKTINRLFLKIRQRFNSVMISTNDFFKQMRNISAERYALGLITDQNPGLPQSAFWLNFFNRPAPFIMGADKGAIRNKTAVVFVNFVKIKRGYYRFDLKVITENAGEFKPGELTLLYRDFLENTIRKQPANYLWSHRRWKREYKVEYRRRWIDKTSPPYS